MNVFLFSTSALLFLMSRKCGWIGSPQAFDACQFIGFSELFLGHREVIVVLEGLGQGDGSDRMVPMYVS